MDATHEASRGRKARWRAVALVGLALVLASLLPSPLRRHPAFGTVGPDKLLHLLGYGGFAAVLADALAAGRTDSRAPGLLAVVASTGFGLVVGRLQGRVPGRAAERADHVAGLVGSILGVFAWRRGYLSRWL